MSHKIIIKDPEAFRARLQQDDRLFDSVVRILELGDADDREFFHVTTAPGVLTARSSSALLHRNRVELFMGTDEDDDRDPRNHED